jgi:hypothetical protein
MSTGSDSYGRGKIIRTALKNPKSWIAMLAVAGWTILTAFATSTWTVFESMNKRADVQRSEALSRRLEAQKPFLQKKLDLYIETAEVSSRLVEWAADPKSSEWKKNAKRFWELRWSHLEVVGDPGVRQAMRRLGQEIIEVEHDPAKIRHDLRWSVECLADELRESLEAAWYTGSEAETKPSNEKRLSPSGCKRGPLPPDRQEGMEALKAPANLNPKQFEQDALKAVFRQIENPPAR